ncbi:YajG family lipoprotein [Thaumasiovibrio sp. DFM-14]|uniref:YajG family lipoprotein n=1 Tax=Thaumasiovibrio sp. DFM-14 TaxID=3384792 RepID=UPI00399FEE16
MIKKLVLAVGILALTACSAPSDPQLVLQLDPQISIENNGQGTAISVQTQDLRSAQFLALVDTGREQKTPLHAKQSLRVTFEDALVQLLTEQDYLVSNSSTGTMRVDILDALLNVQHSVIKHEMVAKAHVQVVVESNKGKFVKRFTGNSSASGLGSASVDDMSAILSNLMSNVLSEISNDSELNTYIVENL